MLREYVNRKNASRKKFIISMIGSACVFIAWSYAKYFFSSPAVQQGLESSRSGLSLNMFRVYAVGAIVLVLFVMFWARIVLRLQVNVDDNFLSVDIIGRYRFTSKRHEVLLSETQIQIVEFDGVTEPQYVKTLYLIHPSFGELCISPNNFDEIIEIVSLFENIRNDAARKIRERRMGRRRR